MPRARSIQIYLKQGIEQDDQLLALWSVCRDRSRPQEVFRKMLSRGFEAMREAGELPDSIVDAVSDAIGAGVSPAKVASRPQQERHPAPASRPAPKPGPERREAPERPAGQPVAPPAPSPSRSVAPNRIDEEGGDGERQAGAKHPFIGDIM